MEFQSLLTKLLTEIKNPLPGHNAHFIASPKGRLSTEEYLSLNPSYKSGCVTMLVFPDNTNQARLLLIERADGDDAHSGQISFPGGRREMDDRTLEETALRETYEEVGIDPSLINIIGRMTDLFIPVSNYLVHPFLGYLENFPPLKPSPGEVKKILIPTIDELMIPVLPTARFRSRLSGLIEAPYYPYDDFQIWGATAMMISELRELIKK